VCLELIPATIRKDVIGVVMDKTCSRHGRVIASISSDLATYAKIRQTSRKVTPRSANATDSVKGCPYDCGLCPAHDQHTCLAILEVTSRCNLMCPICLASSEPQGFDMSPAVAEQALRNLIKCEGKVTPLQFSGGEPTLHNNLEEILRIAKSLGFPDIEIDTNGLAMGRDSSLAPRLKDAGLSLVYLQMDGLNSEVSKWIRGRDIIEEKIRAIENCQKAGLQVALSVTVVPGVNDGMLWEMVRFGIDRQVRGINFQSVALNGRFPTSLIDANKRVTLGHFLHEIEKQSSGKILSGDLTPIPCPDPRCGAMMYALIDHEELVPLNRLLDSKELMDLYADVADWDKIIRKINWETSPSLSTCGCCAPSCCDEEIPLGEIFARSDCFSVGFHGMMDAYNFDLDRAKRCCVHALAPDGRLIPFCLYNIKYRRQYQSRD
jgi:hypothetical protein